MLNWGGCASLRRWKTMECGFPPCPRCDKGHMIPFSMGHDTYELWKCTNCTHVVYKKQ